jgi:hypothetical protein
MNKETLMNSSASSWPASLKLINIAPLSFFASHRQTTVFIDSIVLI